MPTCYTCILKGDSWWKRYWMNRRGVNFLLAPSTIKLKERSWFPRGACGYNKKIVATMTTLITIYGWFCGRAKWTQFRAETGYPNGLFCLLRIACGVQENPNFQIPLPVPFTPGSRPFLSGSSLFELFLLQNITQCCTNFPISFGTRYLGNPASPV